MSFYSESIEIIALFNWLLHLILHNPNSIDVEKQKCPLFHSQKYGSPKLVTNRSDMEISNSLKPKFRVFYSLANKKFSTRITNPPSSNLFNLSLFHSLNFVKNSIVYDHSTTGISRNSSWSMHPHPSRRTRVRKMFANIVMNGKIKQGFIMIILVSCMTWLLWYMTYE